VVRKQTLGKGEDGFIEEGINSELVWPAEAAERVKFLPCFTSLRASSQKCTSFSAILEKS